MILDIDLRKRGLDIVIGVTVLLAISFSDQSEGTWRITSCLTNRIQATSDTHTGIAFVLEIFGTDGHGDITNSSGN